MAPLPLSQIFYLLCLTSLTCAELYTNLFAVHIEGGEKTARSIAEKHGLSYDGKIMDDFYHMSHRNIRKRSLSYHSETNEKLNLDSKVLWYQQQVGHRRVKRDLMFTDTQFRHQWYLHSHPGRRRSSSMSMNIQAAWSKGYTGKGVVVTILDDGIETTHPDLSRNYDPDASWDINGKDDDPTPRYDFSNENRHGTRCAGEVAAVANNSFCAVGVAYEASIGGIRMLDGDVTDSVEAMSLSLNRNHIDIYSASWGPDDDGKTVDGPAVLTRRAFRDGVLKGRHGKGSIFVWASGNGGRDYDNCNCDGYTNSIYTLSVSSATENGNIPWYSEACSSTLVSTYSSGDHKEKQITTTDLRRGCTNLHTGTSASAPLAAGIVALALQANPSLTWRDIQYISVLAASRGSLAANDWVTNGAGKEVSHHFGFGMMDASKMVDLASNWTNIPEQHICEVASLKRNVVIAARQTIRIVLPTSGCANTRKQVSYLEHVQAKISLSSSWRGDLQIYLTSPSGTRSTLLSRRVNDDSSVGFNEWAFLTTHNWGEHSEGEWVLEIYNGFIAERAATLREWTLILYGTATDPMKRDVPITTTTSTTTTTTTPVFQSRRTTTTAEPKPMIRPTAATFSGTFTLLNYPIRSSTPAITTQAPVVNFNVINHIPNYVPQPSGFGYGWPDDTLTAGDGVATPSNTIDASSNSDVRCLDRFLYYKGQCIETCLDGYYPGTVSGYGGVCLPCHRTCARCKGEHNSSCTQCYHGFRMVKGTCARIIEDNQLYTGASVSRFYGLSQQGLNTVIYSAITTLSVLLIILTALVVYYMYSRHKSKTRSTANRLKPQVGKDTIYSPVSKDNGTDSKHSSQQELVDSDEEDLRQSRPTTSSSTRSTTASSSTGYKYPPCAAVQQLV